MKRRPGRIFISYDTREKEWGRGAHDSGRPQRDSKAQKAQQAAASRNDPQREGVRPGAGPVRNVAERGRLDESLDDSRGGGRLEPEALVGVVATALAQALKVAADAGRWDIVAQLAEELAARRRGRDDDQTESAEPLPGTRDAR